MHLRMVDFDMSSEPTAEDIDYAWKDLALSQRIYQYIIGHLPAGYVFRVSTTTRGGIARIEHPLLPPTFGYTIHLKDLANEYGWKQLLKAANLILEIFELPRHRYNRDLYIEKSRKFRNTKLGIFKREVDLSTGKSRLIMPDWVGAK